MFSNVRGIKCVSCPYHEDCRFGKEKNDLPLLLALPDMNIGLCEPVTAFVIDYLEMQTEDFCQLYSMYLESDMNILAIQKQLPYYPVKQIRYELMNFCFEESRQAFSEWKEEKSISEQHKVFREHKKRLLEKEIECGQSNSTNIYRRIFGMN